MPVKLGKRKTTGKRPHFHRENSSPAVLANRSPERMVQVRAARGKSKKLKEITEDVLNRQVNIDGVDIDTVAEAIVLQRATEAMQPNDDRGLALAATQFLFDRSEGRAVARQEVSGPDGGPIEHVQEHVLLAKLLS